MVLVAKNLPASEGGIRDTGPIPGSGRSPGEGNGNPLQYSCLENPMDGGGHWATVHGVRKSQTRLSCFTLLHSTMTYPSWVALHGMAHSFIELDKAVVHVISLISFL